MNYSRRAMHLSDCLSLIYSQNRRIMLGRIEGPLHSDLIMRFNWKRITILFSYVKEPTEENANMLFVTNAMRNIQKPRREQEVVLSVKMSWCRLVIMNTTQFTVMCWCVVVYQRLLGRSPVVRTCHGVCFQWEDVYYGWLIIDEILWGLMFIVFKQICYDLGRGC